MHHNFEANLQPRQIVIYPPEEHEDGLSTEWGFTCEHHKERVQQCEDCGASMTMAFSQAGPEGSQHELHLWYRLVYEFQVGIRVPNRDHKCDPMRNPSCREAEQEKTKKEHG